MKRLHTAWFYLYDLEMAKPQEVRWDQSLLGAGVERADSKVHITMDMYVVGGVLLGQFLGVMEVFLIFIVIVATCVCTFFKIHRSVQKDILKILSQNTPSSVLFPRSAEDSSQYHKWLYYYWELGCVYLWRLNHVTNQCYLFAWVVKSWKLGVPNVYFGYPSYLWHQLVPPIFMCLLTQFLPGKLF